MKKSIETVINSKMHPSLIVYLRESSSLADEIYNQALFVQRQLYISFNKDDSALSDNEREVLNNVSRLGITPLFIIDNRYKIQSIFQMLIQLIDLIILYKESL